MSQVTQWDGLVDFTVLRCVFTAKVNKLTLHGVSLVHSFARLLRRGGTKMRLWIRVLWTAVALVAIAWPLLFWGKAASLDGVRQPALYNPLERHELLW